MMTSKIEDRLRKNGVKIKKVLQVAQMVYDILLYFFIVKPNN